LRQLATQAGAAAHAKRCYCSHPKQRRVAGQCDEFLLRRASTEEER
jgi:hypothetical protein